MKTNAKHPRSLSCRTSLCAGMLLIAIAVSAGCRTPTPTSRPSLPPGTRLPDGSQSYQVGPEHPLAQQAEAIRAAAAAQGS